MHKVHDPEISKEEKRKLWDDLIEEFNSCNQTVKSFSAAKGLKSDHLSYYISARKKKLKQQSVNASGFIPLTITNNLSSNFKLQIGTATAYLPLNISAATLSNIVKGMSC